MEGFSGVIQEQWFSEEENPFTNTALIISLHIINQPLRQVRNDDCQAKELLKSIYNPVSQQRERED